MDCGLVVTGESDRHLELLREAGELADGVDAELKLYVCLTEGEIEQGEEAIQAISRVEEVRRGPVLDAAMTATQEDAREQFEGLDVDYEVVGDVVEDRGDVADAILETAGEHDCDHVFIRGRRRSPTGKAVFGDTAQSVILNFDDYVTVATR